MNRQELQRLFENFQLMKVLIIGDVMVDSYIFGKVDRISPEAPVPVVNVQRKESRPGGAANVARNIKALGATPILAGCIGKDRDGDELMRMLSAEGLSTEGMIKLDRPTTVKSRIIGNHHQLLRIDDESEEDLQSQEAEIVEKKIMQLLAEVKFDAVIFEDYDKGLISDSLIKAVVEYCNNQSIIVTADPKKRNFLSYFGVDLFKPNLKEIREGLKISVNPASDESLRIADEQLRFKLNHRYSLITLSEHGLIYCNGHDLVRIPAEEIHIADVSGAGDTVISAATLCLAAGLDMKSTAAIANLAGASVCERVGVVPVDASELFDSALIALTESINNE
jgi:D-glycero-beta-D-manno-heptose-7-phosphate kinase